MKNKYIVLIFIFSFQSLTAWGKTGHRIVGEIAETLLTENAKMQIKKLNILKKSPTWMKAGSTEDFL